MKKYISVVRTIALIALFCTIILWLGLWGSSLVPGDKSGDMTNKVDDKVNSIFGVQNKLDSNVKPQAVKIWITNPKPFYFFEDHPQVQATIDPSNATDSELEFTISSSFSGGGEATIDENGYVTFTKRGPILVRATLKSDASIWNHIQINCCGYDPLPSDGALPAVELKDGALVDMQVGTAYSLLFNDDETLFDCVSVSIEDTSIVWYDLGCFYPRKAGTTKLIATVTNGERTEIIEKEIVTHGVIPVVPDIVFKDPDDIDITQSDLVETYSLLENVDYNNDLYHCIVTSSNNSILRASNPDKISAQGSGKVILTYTSVFDPEISASIEIDVKRIPMDYMKMIGPDVIMPGDTSNYYRVETYPTNYIKDVEWSVLKGRATITQDGILTADMYGTVVIRCQSLYDPSIYADKTIKVSLYSSSYSFVRKFMGHMGLSALLGFGLFFTAILLCPKKWQTVFIIPISFGYAGISELLQKITPGRTCQFNDVMIDFIGALIGIVVAILFLVSILLVWRLINKNGCKKLTGTVKIINYKNAFKSVDYILGENNFIEPNISISESMVTTDVIENISENEGSSE